MYNDNVSKSLYMGQRRQRSGRPFNNNDRQ